jgi:hypothetical protein
MGLKDVLAKLKLVETDGGGESSAPAPGSSSGKAARTQSLEELLASVPAVEAIDESKLPKRRASSPGAPPPPRPQGAARIEPGAETPPPPPSETDSGSPLDDVPPFADVYRAAGITDPPHGFTAFKVLEILSSAEFSTLPPAAKAGALAGFLKMNPGGPVPLAEVIQDAVRRDQALDRFDEFLRGKLAERASAFDRENARLQSEIDELVRSHRERIEANRRTLDAERARFDEWLTLKRAEEARLSLAVAPFVEGNPISSS